MRKMTFIAIGLAASLYAVSFEQVDESGYRPRYDLSIPLTKKMALYATNYNWIKPSFEYSKSFEIVDTTALEEINKEDAKSFKKPLAYVWLAGFYKYETESNPIAKWAYEHRGTATLNTTPMHVHNGDPEYYYDLCNEELRHKRADYIASTVKKKHIGGIFFDWGNSKFLDEPEFAQMKEEVQKRHNKPYWRCIYDFFKELKQKGVFIVANQAYRDPELMKTIDYDMTESYLITDDEKNGVKYTLYQPKSEVLEYFDYLGELKNSAKRYGFKNIIYMNYAAPKRVGKTELAPLEDIAYSYAMAKIGGFVPYTEVPANRVLEFTDLYFYDLGKEIGDYVNNPPLLYREFEKGLVIVSDPIQKYTYYEIDGLDGALAYDATERYWVEIKNGKAVVRFTPHYDSVTKKYRPVAKVLVIKRDKTYSEERTQQSSSSSIDELAVLPPEPQEEDMASQSSSIASGIENISLGDIDADNLKRYQDMLPEYRELLHDVFVANRFHKARLYELSLNDVMRNPQAVKKALEAAKQERVNEVVKKIMNGDYAAHLKVAGYFVNYGRGQYDWAFVGKSGIVYKLEGVNESGSFRYSILEDLKGYINDNDSTIRFRGANTNAIAKSLKGRSFRGMPFAQYGDIEEKGFDWVLIASHDVYKIEGYDPVAKGFVYTKLHNLYADERKGDVTIEAIRLVGVPYL